jgi:hypothetical protein
MQAVPPNWRKNRPWGRLIDCNACFTKGLYVHDCHSGGMYKRVKRLLTPLSLFSSSWRNLKYVTSLHAFTRKIYARIRIVYEAPYSFQTKGYLNLKKLFFCTINCFLLYKRVILTHNRYSSCYHDNMTSPSIAINQKSRLSGQITTVTYLFYCRKYIVMKFWIFFESYL